MDAITLRKPAYSMSGPSSSTAVISASRKRTRNGTTGERTAPTKKITAESFAELQAPHPYGVLPLGNRFFCQTNELLATYSHVLGWNAATLLTEDCWNAVLSCLDGVALAAVGQTCRFLYVAAHQPELWRDIVLQQHDGSTIHSMASTWKDTYIQANQTTNIRPHVPMAVSGVYSDVFYRQHSCRSFAIPARWLNGNDEQARDIENSCVVPKVPFNAMTASRFVDEYERPNRPVLIQGAAQEWGAYAKWADPTYCATHTAQHTFRATSGVAPHPAQFTWQAYRQYCGLAETVAPPGNQPAHLLEEGPLYLFDRAALQPQSILWKDYMPDLQRTCPYWDPERRVTDANDTVGHDLFGILGEGRRPDHTWLIVGPKRSGSVFHLDPNCTHAWNAAVCGRKRWIFYPPGVTPPGVHPSIDGDEVALPLSIGEWLFQFWDEHCQRKTRKVPESERPMECTAMPGDVLFVPHGWWHMVINLDDLNIAITHNYVSVSNLSNVLKFLETKRTQVSGCRDRQDSIKPERLYEEFSSAMELHHSEWLQAARAVPDWTCRAWSDSQNHPKCNDATLGIGGNDESASVRLTTSVIEKAKAGASSNFCFSFDEKLCGSEL